MDRKGGKFSRQLIQWDFEERRSRRLNVCVLLRFKKEAANSISVDAENECSEIDCYL